MSTTRKQPKYRVGDRVRIALGPRKVTGVVVEDRGEIGVGGRRLLRISVPADPLEPMEMELPEDDLEPVRVELDAPLDKGKIIEYLTNGGLTSILRANLPDNRTSAGVWLCRDQLGNVTHTFVAERGVVGGEPIPYSALRGHKILGPRRDAVISFVESFGLTRGEAEEVVSEIGTVA